MIADDDKPAAAPEWLLTYGDMMSLLLTIFVMLVSMGELKQTDKFQGVADSLHEQFGTDGSLLSLLPGELRPRNALLAAVVLTGRAQRNSALESRSSGSASLTRATAVATLHFQNDELTLTAAEQEVLRRLAKQLTDKAHKIELRGYSGLQIVPAAMGNLDPWELAYRRAHRAMHFLVSELNVDPAQIRISAAAAPERAAPGPDMRKKADNPTVEVILLAEEAKTPFPAARAE